MTVYIALYGLDENTPVLLNALEKMDLPVCIFLTAEEIYASDDLVRRVLGEGGCVGVRFVQEPETEAEAYRKALRDVAMCTGFLAASDDPSLLSREDAEELGVSLWSADGSAGSFSDCRSRLETAKKDCVLLLNSGFDEMSALRSKLEKEHYTVSGITDTMKARKTP